MIYAVCSVCGGRIAHIAEFGKNRWYHVGASGRTGECTRERYLEQVRLGCYNRAQPADRK